MLKISESRPSTKLQTLRVEGRLVGPWVDELRRICESRLTQKPNLALDLKDVSFADPEGVALLTRLQTRGAALRNLTPFVEEQIRRSEKTSADD